MIPTMRNLSIWITDFLSGTRPVSFVRKMQIYLLIITVLGATFALSYPGFSQSEIDPSRDGEWAVGKNAPLDVVALSSLEFPRMEQFKINQEEARRRAPLHFVRDFQVLGNPLKVNEKPEEGTFRYFLELDIDRFVHCRSKSRDIGSLRNCVRSEIPRWKSLGNRQMDALVYQNPTRIQELLQQTVNILFQRFVILKDPLEDQGFDGTSLKVRDINSGNDTQVNSVPAGIMFPRSRLFSPAIHRNFSDLIRERVPGPGPALLDALVSSSIRYLYLIHGSRFDPDATLKERDQAQSKVEIPIYRITRGELIIKKGEVVTDEKSEVLKTYVRVRFLDKVRRILAVFVQQVVLISIILYFAFRFGFRRLSDVSSNLIIFFLVWLFIATLFLQNVFWLEKADYNEVSHFFGAWVPIGLFSVLLSIIFGEVLTIPLGFYLAFLVFVASKYDPNTFIIAITIAMLASILGSRINKRVHFITVSLIITVASFLMVSAGYMYSSRPILGKIDGEWFSRNYLDAVQVTILSGMSTVLAIVILPLFESLFNVPTRFKLTELTDPSSPLLQELFRKAPSTWTHTMMVASLSEKACERLGLNSILARTGVYYHDIGKMKNPSFFIENKAIMPEKNISETAMTPEDSARVVINHVLDGIELAREARLPREVIAFIPEHHGTSTMSFFYHKALEKSRRKGVDRSRFRYPGPKPHSRETAIVMIADSVEAASRSLEEVSPEKIEELIQKIINIKIAENQLDESGLTIGDLRVIRESFRDVLLSSYHNRPRYPDQGKTEELEKTTLKKATRKKSGTARKKGPSGGSTKGKTA